MLKHPGEALEEIQLTMAKTEEDVELEEEAPALIIQQEDIQQEMTIIQTEDGTQIPLEHVQQLQDGLHGLTAGSIVVTEEQEHDGMALEQGALEIAGEDGTVIISTEDGQVHVMPSGDQVIEDHIEHVTVEDQMAGVEHVAMETVQVPEDQLEGVTDEQIEEGDLPQYQNIIIQHMDISEPLTTLRKLLESRLQCSLHDHEFYLQDSIPLDPTKNLVSQCVQGSGMVQINVEVKSQPSEPNIRPRLNIVDILKPAEEVEPAPAPVVAPPPQPSNHTPTKVVIPFPEEAENVTRWIVDQNFRKEQERLKIPFDPVLWNETHVRHWIQWAVKEFSLDGVDIDNFSLSGRQLCELKHEEFIEFIPNDKGDIFWTHLELLRKCKFVAVIQQPTPHAITTITVSTSHPELGKYAGKTPKSFSRTPRARTIMLTSDRSSPGNRTGNNGQIQLWQFLLELLTDKDCQEVIHWLGDEGEFKLNNPEMVAQMWGQRKNKPTMNYEKLSRALRYYYDGDMIAKVHGKRFVYKFVCDLRMLLGYTAGELNRLVKECADKRLQKVRETLRPGIVRRVIETKS